MSTDRELLAAALADDPEYVPLPPPPPVPGKARPTRVVERDIPFEIDDSDCYVWTGPLSGQGYGSLRLYGQGHNAHRAVWLDTVGQIPAGHELDHLCRNRACINPDHMEVVTPRENIRRSQSVTAANMHKTHCDKGHPFDEVNTRITYRGTRSCRICASEWKRAKRSHCPKGHELAGENLRLVQRGNHLMRRCGTCVDDRRGTDAPPRVICPECGEALSPRSIRSHRQVVHRVTA